MRSLGWSGPDPMTCVRDLDTGGGKGCEGMGEGGRPASQGGETPQRESKPASTLILD